MNQEDSWDYNYIFEKSKQSCDALAAAALCHDILTETLYNTTLHDVTVTVIILPFSDSFQSN